MADIGNEIDAIRAAKIGEQVREDIAVALEKMNEQAAVAQEWATGEDDPTAEPGPENNAAYYAAQAAAQAGIVSGVPEGYARVKWLQSDGDIRIDSGIILNQDSRVTCRFAAGALSPESANYVFGARQTTSTYKFLFGQNTDNRMVIGYAGAEYVFPETPLLDLNFHIVDYNANSVYLDGELVTTITASTFETTTSCRIYAAYAVSSNKYYYGNFKISEIIFYADGTTKTKHFIPVRRLSDDALGLYDLVGEAFYAGEGTGSFISGGDLTINDLYDTLDMLNWNDRFVSLQNQVGAAESDIAEYIDPLPDGYRKLDYLQSDSTQLINLGVEPDGNTRFVCRYAFLGPNADAAQYVFGSRYTAYTNQDAFTFLQNTDDTIGVNYINELYVLGKSDTKVHVIDINKNKFYLDGTLVTSAASAMAVTGYNSMYLFGMKGGPSGQTTKRGWCRIYSAQIYDDGTLTHDYVPCVRLSDGKTGVYDTVDNAFIASDVTLAQGNDMTLPGLSEKIDKTQNDVTDLQSATEELSAAALTKDYVQTEADRVAAKVRDVQNPDVITILAVSDMHYKEGNETIAAALDDMAKGANAIRQQIHVDYMLCAGDIIWRMNADKDFAIGQREAIAATKILGSCFGDAKQIRLVGNHDINTDGTQHFSHNQRYSYFGIFTDSIPGTDKNHSYGYIDDEKRKTRIICLNTTETSTNYGILPDQLRWLAATLDLSGKEDAASWKIIVMSHVTLDNDLHPSGTTYREHMTILDAYIRGASFSYVYNVSGTNYTIAYDYTGKNAATLALYINGHEHMYDVASMINASDEAIQLPRVGLPNALPDRDYPSITGITYTKTAGTAESTSFVVLAIDTAAGIVYAYHYGAGVDMILHYAPVSAESTVSQPLTTALASPTWVSRDTNIATVSSGTVTAVAAGHTIVYAYSETDNSLEAWNLSVTV